MKRIAFNKQEIIKTTTYVEALEKGLVDYDDIDDFIHEWHDGNSTLEIDEFLGMTEQQYAKYVEEDIDGLRKMFKKGNLK